MGNLGFTEIMIILVVVLLVFGAKRLPEIGSSMGKGIREFKRSLSDTADAISNTPDDRAAPGRAHLKTGSLRDVAGVAGWVLSNSGKRYVLVALINHPNANAARPALDAVVQWAMRDAPSH